MNIELIVGVIFAVTFILVILGFIFGLALIFNPKLKGKMLSTQMKSVKYMMDESKEDIESVSTDMANATKEGIKITANAIKEGFTGKSIFCKHCGSKIDEDSKFCKVCGKEQ